MEVGLVDPARAEVLTAAGAVLEALAAAQVAEDPAAEALAVAPVVAAQVTVEVQADPVEQALAVAPVVAVQVTVEVQADPVEQALAVAARLAAEVQRPSLANGLRPRRLSAAESSVEFPASPECPVQQALAG
jgi:hypothetical protein